MATVTEVVEMYTENDYRDMLVETCEEVRVCGSTFSPADVLEEMDPTAFRCGFADYQEYETVYICDNCGEKHENELNAEFCCDDEEEEDEEYSDEDEAYDRASSNAGELI